MNRVKSFLLAAATILPVLAPSWAPPAFANDAVVRVNANGSTSERVKLGLNKSVVVDLPQDAYDILVANPEVADAVTRSARRIYLFGKKVGQTNIFVFDGQGNQIVSLDLTIERDVSGLEEYLQRFIPGSEIKAEIINDNVVLTGRVQTPQDAAKAGQLATVFVTGGEATARPGFFFFGNAGESQIVNMLEIVGEDQVTLKVTVAEVQRTVMKQLGFNVIGAGSTSGGISFNAISQTLSGAVGKPLSASGLGLAGTLGNVTLNSFLNAMEASGAMKTLAEPTLTAISGQSATFRVGGEYSIVTGSNNEDDEEDGSGNVTYSIERNVEYGVGLEFTPVVLSPGRIALKIRTSVSEPTFAGSQSLGVGLAPSTTILSIRKRLADTTVELPSGGTMMIGGLIQDDVRQVVSGFPGLSKLPVLGTLFRSREFVRNETELVILVTPLLVRPNARQEFARPDDNLAPASDGAANLLGRVNRVYGTTDKNLPDGRYHGVVGFIYK